MKIFRAALGIIFASSATFASDSDAETSRKIETLLKANEALIKANTELLQANRILESKIDLSSKEVTRSLVDSMTVKDKALFWNKSKSAKSKGNKGPRVQSIGKIQFGDDSTLFVADWKQAKLFALDLVSLFNVYKSHLDSCTGMKTDDTFFASHLFQSALLPPDLPTALISMI